MTPKQFCTIGEALRGPHWQRALAADLGINERAVRYYAKGTRRVPPEVAPKLVALVRQHIGTLLFLWGQIDP